VTREDVAHYTTGNVETIDYITDKLGPMGSLMFILGNILKYASRALHKGQLRSDLIKIRNYAILAIELIDKHGLDKKE
jgi:hypothetical protein